MLFQISDEDNTVRTEDGHIIQQCLDGDSAAFGLLVDKYRRSIYALAYSRVRDFHDAQDITQEVFIKAYRNLRVLRRWENFMGWLYRITSNLCKDWYKSNSRRPDREFVEDQEPDILAHQSIDSYREAMLYESVQEALDSLPEMYRQMLTLHYFGGMEVKEMARFLCTSPRTIERRLRQARAELKEEILAMMRTTYEHNKLPANFTFRILEMARRTGIHSTPRTSGLPWGLSMAAAAIIAVLGLNPRLGPPNAANSSVSPLRPAAANVLGTGEIPVNVFEVSQVSMLAGRQRGGDSMGSELLNPQTEIPMAAGTEDNTWTEESSPDNAVIVDPQTGIKYTRIKTFTGKRDMISSVGWPLLLKLSPNGKFLLWGELVLPMDDGDPFKLMDTFGRSLWSPDGKKVAYRLNEATWVIPVSPETGRPTGTARKLPGGEYWSYKFSWSPDSERIAFERTEREHHGEIWIISVSDGAMTQITDDPIWEGHPEWSPDGKTIAYRRGYEIRVIPAEGGTSRKIVDRGDLMSWSPDSQWLVYRTALGSPGGKFRLFHLADGRDLEIAPPEAVGDFFGWSSDGKKALFFRTSYDYRETLRVVSASGGSSFELGRKVTLLPYNQFWSSDSTMIVTGGENQDSHSVFWMVPLAGSDPLPLRLDVSVPGEPYLFSLSPDRGKLLFSVGDDLWMVPISLTDGETKGSAVRIFSQRHIKHGTYESCSWSPDGTKLAVTHKENIWIASAEGGEPAQITIGSEEKRWPVWSPDGEMIAYTEYRSGKEPALMVIPASGGEEKEISIGNFTYWRKYEWSPDGKELTFLSQGKIWTADIASGKTRQIADLEHLDLYAPIYVVYPCWSPDGQASYLYCSYTCR